MQHEHAITFTAGLCAGAVSRTCTAPFDRMKVLMQEGRIAQFTMSHPTVNTVQNNMNLMSAYRVILRDGGIGAFWRGNFVNCLKAGPEFAAAFTFRELLLENVCCDRRKPSMAENFFVGAMGGGMAQIVIYPMELVKARMAVSTPGEFKGIADCISQCHRKGGVREFYKGLGANLSGVVPHRGLEMGMFFTLEQIFCKQFGVETPDVLTMTLFGFMSSTYAQIITYPLNLARTKIQTQGMNGRPIRYHGTWDCIRTVVREEGVRGLFRGLVPNLMKAVPASTLMYIVFKSTKGVLETWKRKQEKVIN
eukprot:PhF_6_TR6828/c0_g1_i1/m.9832/K14684/SLC25A23S; solute carrier family 25 (mitochondrial phosphate transporter), member 23/24/25/41